MLEIPDIHRFSDDTTYVLCCGVYIVYGNSKKGDWVSHSIIFGR